MTAPEQSLSEQRGLGPNARAAAVVAGLTIVSGCLPSLGFYSRSGIVLSCLGLLFGLGALTRPAWLSKLAQQPWPRRLLAAAGPLLLLHSAYLAALDPQPRSLVFPLFLLSLALLTVSLLRPPPEDLLDGTLPGLLPLACGVALLHTKLMFVEAQPGATALSWAWLVGLLLALLGLNQGWLAHRHFRGALLAGLLAVGLTVRGGAILASPNPVIDVYSVLTQAPAALLRGENPYELQLVSPYGTERARRFRVGEQEATPDPEFYTPGILLYCLPAAALRFDPRWLLTLAWLGVAVATWRRAQAALGPVAALRLAGLLLLFPSASFTSEQSWVDIAFGLCYVLGFGPLSPWLGGVLCGFGMTVKQTTMFCLAAAVVRWRRSGAALVGLLGAILAVNLPFLLWNPHEFLKDVMLGYLHEPIRDASMSLPAMLVREAHWAMPTAPLPFVMVAFAVWAAWRARSSAAALLLAAGLALLVLNLLTKAAFMNYYEIAAVLLVVSAGWTDRLTPEVAE